ncbi:MAG TPA: response regulator transcription factor [Chloroflexota bacterium]|jgi:DNA-binding NarL/FixJ family response regulator|nr:response regulator transcription factor [Chloroflexota bacterium]
MSLKKRLLIADDHGLMREVMACFLEAAPDLEVVAEAADGREAVALAATCQPDVVLMDISMPQMNGLEATRQIVSQTPGIKVLVITASRNEGMLQQLFDAGAAGFVLKTGDTDELLHAVRAVLQGKRYVSAGLASREPAHADQPVTRLESLTAREREVLQLIGEGRTNRDIAEQLCLSVKTVEVHRGRIADKLGVRGRSLLVKYSISSGLACA